MPTMPSVGIDPCSTGKRNARRTRIVSFWAVSAPERSSEGSASANPSFRAASSASAKSRPSRSMVERMKLVVPFRMPTRSWNLSVRSPWSSDWRIGMTPPTDAS